MKLIAAGGLVLSVSLTLAGMLKAEEPNVAVAEVPVTGENSFTQAQAKAWIEDAGYTHVGDLVLGTDGVWRGSARLEGNPALVRLDYQGNITTQ